MYKMCNPTLDDKNSQMFNTIATKYFQDHRKDAFCDAIKGVVDPNNFEGINTHFTVDAKDYGNQCGPRTGAYTTNLDGGEVKKHCYDSALWFNALDLPDLDGPNGVKS